jgi:hypothetical protein
MKLRIEPEGTRNNGPHRETSPGLGIGPWTQ